MKWYPSQWFFIFMQLLSLVVFVYAILNPVDPSYWLLSLLGYFLITCLGITVTFHRLLAHRSYRLNKTLEYVFSFLGNLGCTGSSIGWVFIHRQHHRNSDRVGDPHSPKTLGAIGAFVGDYSGKFNKWTVKELINDPVHRFMHEKYIALVLLTLSILLIIDPLLAVYLFFIPVFFNTMASRLSNWIDHTESFGNRVYKTGDQSHNVWWWSYLTFGEGWHNNHHRYPNDWKIGREWWQFDLGKYVIQFLIFLKLAFSKTNSYNKLRS